MTTQVIIGDCREALGSLPDASVNCCVTSPPYFGLRDYGVDGQIGLEQTPQAYVDELVAVFREVKRVLRDDGTLWLNLGDSYNAHPGQRKTTDAVGPKQMSNRGSPGAPSRHVSELKPKDLIGIPWRVAFALQQPWYAGRIKDERDRIWLAAMIDGEGCFYVHKRGAGLHAGDGYIRQTDTFSPAVEVANTNLAIIERCLAIAGCGAISRQDKDRRQPLFRWTARSDEARALTREVYPYLVAKQQQARIICGMPNNGTMADAAWQGMKLLHAGSATTADFAAPASLHEPGWYLRQDVIWAKPNPMPESVRDRCTKAHEYVFMLSKSPRYLYDAEAISEEAIYAGLTDQDESGFKDPASFAGKHSKPDKQRGHSRRHAGFNERWDKMAKAEQSSGRRNKRSVWTIATRPFAEAHFATMAPELARLCIMAGCPLGGLVLDPFGGAGTTGLVADQLQRNAVLIELNPTYAEMAQRRITQDAGMFGSVA